VLGIFDRHGTDFGLLHTINLTVTHSPLERRLGGEVLKRKLMGRGGREVRLKEAGSVFVLPAKRIVTLIVTIGHL